MKRIAIVGGGIAGLAAAYELEKQRLAGADLDWHLYEAANRLGGIVSTTRIDTASGQFILEDGPDGWVTDKPWARDLAIELGLEADIIPCNETQRKTYVLIPDGTHAKLEPMPARMRMMVPEDLATLEGSALFTAEAKAAYANELANAQTLKASAPISDESVASFVARHFGKEVLDKIGAPLLGGVFGGDAHKLSVQSVMPQFVAMEREHGSLIAALQAKAKERGERPPHPAFHSLKNGMGSLAEAIVAKLPPERLHLNEPALSLKREGKLWCLRTARGAGKAKRHFQHVLLATPVDATRDLLTRPDATTAALIPSDASSAVLVAMGWEADTAGASFERNDLRFDEDRFRFEGDGLQPVHQPSTQSARGFSPGGTLHEAATIPEGFGFLVPEGTPETTLLAATFVDQKYPHRAPAGGHILRAFFGGKQADILMQAPDAIVIAAAHEQLSRILGTLPAPNPKLTTVRRWPRSLPQYEVGHLERMAELDTLIARLGNLTLLGNAYRGVGVPDLIRDARAAACNLAQ